MKNTIGETVTREQFNKLKNYVRGMIEQFNALEDRVKTLESRDLDRQRAEIWKSIGDKNYPGKCDPTNAERAEFEERQAKAKMKVPYDSI